MSKKQDKQSLAASQAAANLAALSQLFSQPGSASSNYGAFLQDSAQGQASAQQDYIARKKAKEEEKKKGLGGLIGGAAGIVAAPFTGGASLAAVPGLMSAGSGVASGDYAGAIGGLASAGAAGMDAGMFGGGGVSPTKAGNMVVNPAASPSSGNGLVDAAASAGNAAQGSQQMIAQGYVWDAKTGTWKKPGNTDPLTAGLGL